MDRTIFDEEHRLFRASFRTFLEREVAPHYRGWEEAGIVPRALWERAGAAGFLSMGIAEQDGGAGVDDYRYNDARVQTIYGGTSEIMREIIGRSLFK